MQEFINVKKIHKRFAKTEVLRGLDLILKEKEQYVIQGASGSGKSTLLYMLGGLDRPDSGTIKVGPYQIHELEDEALAHYRNQFVGFVFQFHYLLPSMNAIDNILLPARIAGIKQDQIEKKVKELAQHLGVVNLLNKYPFELSGGEQQRVNLLRALSLSPKLLLCDEPTGNLDSENSEKVTLLLKELSRNLGTTLVVVTHDPQVALKFPHQIYLKDGLVTSFTSR